LLKSNKRLFSIAGAFLAGVACVLVFYSSAEANSVKTPGSADDPVVTKSYVDAKVAELVKAELDKRGTTNAAAPSTSGGSAGPSLEVVVVPVGKTMIVKAGGELVIRTGSAVAVSSDTNGLPDLTDGVDIAPGKPVGNNHLIWFPRDGRGVTTAPDSKTDLIVLVRGEYELK
jgi:hypothetical protein